ncbi:unnamed protein product [Chrysoparadoxa australica]
MGFKAVLGVLLLAACACCRGFYQMAPALRRMGPLGGQSTRASSQLAASFDPEELTGKRVWTNFAAFGFANRTCQVTLGEDGSCTFSQGMVTKTPGSWRIEEDEEDGVEYLQFTCPLTELYSQIFDVPSELMFWRGILQEEGDKVIVTDGVIISEKSSVFGLKTDFINEGNFTARVLENDERFPSEGGATKIELRDPSVATAQPKKTTRKRKGGLVKSQSEL